MTTSYTTTASETFTMASAQYVASKIATDLRQLQRYYHKPSDTEITDYAVEAAVLAYHGYIKKVIYGFMRNEDWILTLEYSYANGTLTADDRAGGVHRYADVTGTVFDSYLYYTPSWSAATDARREEITKSLPITRTPATAPGYTGGFHTSDRIYSAHGTGFTRNSYRPR